MAEQILTFTFLAVGAGLFAYATLGRLFGIHRPPKWVSGGELTFSAELCCSVFVLSMGLAVLQDAAGWIVPALTAWIGGFISQRRAHRRHAAAEDELRTRNSAKFLGVFDRSPPTDIDATTDQEYDLFDAGACTYIGKATKVDLKAVINQLRDMPDQGPNDLFMIPEDLGMFPEGALSEEFVALLNGAFQKRDDLTLRWLPPTGRSAASNAFVERTG